MSIGAILQITAYSVAHMIVGREYIFGKALIAHLG